jgi:hypothetical protein
VESSPFAAWSNFYTITGSSAAALTGLMFIVITLVASRPKRTADRNEGTATYSSPTVVHLTMSFLISALLAAPWHAPIHAGITIAILGIFGLGYMLVVLQRARRLTAYRPPLEDVLWYIAAPLAAYAVLTLAACSLAWWPNVAAGVLAGDTLALIAIGIHNAWDIVVYIGISTPDE